jgi:hypothetical protein
MITTSIDEEHNGVPSRFALEQHYPNPFNPSTTIRYGLPHKSGVQLTVFNTLGQQVTPLQNREQEAGYHEVKFDGNGLSSGVYFYRIQAGVLLISCLFRHDQPCRCGLSDLLAKFTLLPKSNLAFLCQLSEGDWKRIGTASNNPVSVRALAFIMVGHVRHHVNVLGTSCGVRPRAYQAPAPHAA